ncbi:unnamed protein product [Hymenolepis diminuta]|uniref:Uncharacterized protein n=1 Tax=Hymenolepis diminuta TaxID=6216 RepID=A0A3P6ZLJ1_HYMDI|nr:unnamed protein product [Hymenolepis diminuta]
MNYNLLSFTIRKLKGLWVSMHRFSAFEKLEPSRTTPLTRNVLLLQIIVTQVDKKTLCKQQRSLLSRRHQLLVPHP